MGRSGLTMVVFGLVSVLGCLVVRLSVCLCCVRTIWRIYLRYVVLRRYHGWWGKLWVLCGDYVHCAVYRPAQVSASLVQ